MPKTQYSPHHRDHAEGHIFLEKDGPCTITLTGAASMSQAELDAYGEICAKALRAALRKVEATNGPR